MTNRTYWIFTLTFWLLATALLYVSAMKGDHLEEVMVRFFFLPVLGILICAFQTLVYQGDGFRKLRFPQPWVVLIAVLSAFLIAFTLNFMTFLMLDLDFRARHGELFHHGAPIYLIIFLFWAFIWFQLDGRPLLGPKPSNGKSHLEKINVEHLGKITSIHVRDVEFFSAAGDYVEIQLENQSFLRKGTITALEELLDSDQFPRVHRSTIINRDRVREITQAGSGSFEILFGSGRSVTSSRSYKSLVQSLKDQ